VTGLTPLSVAADRIGLTAMRAAGLLARLAAEGRRSTGPAEASLWRSTGGIAEVLGPAPPGYKGAANRTAREALLDALLAVPHGLNWARTPTCARDPTTPSTP